MKQKFLIKPLKFKQRLARFAIVPFHFRYFFEKYNLAEILFADSIKGMNSYFDEFQISIDTSSEEIQSQVSENLKNFEKQVRMRIKG